MAIDYAYAFKFEGTEYRLRTFLLSEARAVQQAIGKTVQEFDEALSAADPDALAALVWVARKRQEPTLRFEEVDGDIMTFQPLPTTDPAGDPASGQPAAAGPAPAEEPGNGEAAPAA